MVTPLIIFGTLGLFFLIAHLWLRGSINRERELTLSENPIIPDPQACKVKVLEAIASSDETFEAGEAGSIYDPCLSPEASTMWPRMPKEVREFFDLYPHGVSWSGLGHIGGKVRIPTLDRITKRLMNSQPEFQDMLIIGGGEGEIFVASPHSVKIGCINVPLERVDFYESIYELLYSEALSCN